MRLGKLAVFLLLVTPLLSPVTPYKVSVQVYDEHESVGAWSYEHNTTALKGTHLLGKRAATVATPVAPTLESPEECVQRLARMRKHRPQQAQAVKVGTKATLPCHFCPDTNHAKTKGNTDEKTKPHVWLKFALQRRRRNSVFEWKLREVPLDMHDDESKNRVYTEPDNTLVIERFSEADQGTYACIDWSHGKPKWVDEIIVNSKNLGSSETAVFSLAWGDDRRVSSYQGDDFVYHVDAIVAVKPVLVSPSAAGFSRPSRPKRDRARNLLIQTEWNIWGPCSVCGQVGERRRTGKCMVKKLDGNRPAEPAPLDHMLKLYPGGAPCHSSLFSSDRTLKSVVMSMPQEIEVSKCKVECKKVDSLLRNSGWGMSSHKALKYGNRIKVVPVPTKPPIARHVVQKRVGETAELFCPGAQPETSVEWMNATKPLLATDVITESKGRISINIMNILHIKNLILSDKATYSCWYDGEERGAVQLRVQEDLPEKEDVLQYKFFLAVSYVLNFIIFMGCLVVRHINRPVQVNRKGQKVKRKRRK